MNNSIIKYYYGDYGDKETLSNSPNGGEQRTASLNQNANNRSASSIGEDSAADSSPVGGSRLGAEWPLWEVFIRSKQGLDHKHVGSLHAADAQMAIENARDVYTRRQEGVSVWVVESKYIHASNPDDAESFYEPANDKVYRHPTFYDLPDEVKQM
jgi:ring-1,2-phenylacetyl-CoA epoxidase subunit PaaB